MEHLKYLWAAYKMGAFKEIPGGLAKEEFTEFLSTYMGENGLSCIVFEADKPVGAGFFWPRGRILQTADLIWFPWASKRNILETYLHFLNEIRKTEHPETGMKYLVLEFAQEKDEKFFVQMCKYGVMRRIGTSHEVYPGKKALVFETRGG